MKYKDNLFYIELELICLENNMKMTMKDGNVNITLLKKLDDKILRKYV
jgi:hypothetical protein